MKSATIILFDMRGANRLFCIAPKLSLNNFIKRKDSKIVRKEDETAIR
ncbi:hypothetical protein [Streptococcus salivarius]|jgi:hypothetical protein|nr:hypothetical protein [Streptococcus salivarius]